MLSLERSQLLLNEMHMGCLSSGSDDGCLAGGQSRARQTVIGEMLAETLFDPVDSFAKNAGVVT